MGVCAGRGEAASGVAGVGAGWAGGVAAPGADATAAASGPRLGSKVERFTNSGVVAILGMPDCWCAGGVGRRVIAVVVAPGAAWTRVGATERGGWARAGFGTT